MKQEVQRGETEMKRKGEAAPHGWSRKTGEPKEGGGRR